MLPLVEAVPVIWPRSFRFLTPTSPDAQADRLRAGLASCAAQRQAVQLAGRHAVLGRSGEPARPTLWSGSRARRRHRGAEPASIPPAARRWAEIATAPPR